MYRNVSFKIDKIFPKYYIAYCGLCKSFNNGYLFSNDAVFSGQPVEDDTIVFFAISLVLQTYKFPTIGILKTFSTIDLKNIGLQ